MHVLPLCIQGTLQGKPSLAACCQQFCLLILSVPSLLTHRAPFCPGAALRGALEQSVFSCESEDN